MKVGLLICIPISTLGASEAVAQPVSQCGSLATTHCGPINLTIQNANTSYLPVVGDAVWGLTNCYSEPTSTTKIDCPNQSYTSMNGQTIMGLTGTYSAMIVVDDAASSTGATSGQRIPYVGTVTNVTTTGSVGSSTLQLTVSGPMTFQVGGTSTVAHWNGIGVSTSGSGYAFASTQTIACSGSCTGADGHVQAYGQPKVMTPVAVSIPAGETIAATGGGGVCTLTLPDQIAIGGTLSTIYGTISGGTISSLMITNPNPAVITGITSSYTKSTGFYLEPISAPGTPNCTLTGSPTINVSYGIVVEQLQYGTGIEPFDATGSAPIPCIYPGQALSSSSDGGTGAVMYCANKVFMGTVTGTLVDQPFVGSVGFGTDNKTFLQAAIGTKANPAQGTMNYASAHGIPECLYLPTGNYLTSILDGGGAGGNTVMQGYGCWRGDEHLHTNIFVIPNTIGTVFAWLNSGSNGSLQDLGATQTFQNFGGGNANQAGAALRDITLIGDRLSTQPQNAVQFFGATDRAYVDNVSIYYFGGHAIFGGAPSTSGFGNFTSSTLQNVRLEFDGGPSLPIGGVIVPAMEISATGTAGSNNIDIANLRIYQSFGPSLWIHNGTSVTSNAADIRLVNIKMEESAISQLAQQGTTSTLPGPALGGDMLEIGDPSALHPTGTINVTNVIGRNLDLTNPVTGFAAIHIAGDTPTDTVGIDLEGHVDATTINAGRGVQIETCSDCRLDLISNSSEDYNLMLGTTVAPGNVCTGFISSTSAATAGTVTYDSGYGTNSPSTLVTSCPVAPLIGSIVTAPVYGTFN